MYFLCICILIEPKDFSIFYCIQMTKRNNKIFAILSRATNPGSSKKNHRERPVVRMILFFCENLMIDQTLLPSSQSITRRPYRLPALSVRVISALSTDGARPSFVTGTPASLKNPSIPPGVK
jgi:hypothetical protein